MRKIVIAILFCCLSVTAVLAQAVDCPSIVKDAFDTAHTVCAETSRNQVCYGNVVLTATPRDGVSDLTFQKAGDIASVTDIQTLQLSSMSLKDDSWGVALMQLQANLPDTLPGQNVTILLFGDVQIQNAVPDSQTDLKPLQAFYFRSGADDAPCAAAPDSGILVQTPKGGVKVNMQVNGVDIQLGSTVYLQAQPSNVMKVSVLEGQVQVTAQGVTQTVPAGQQASVPIDANLQASGAPNPPQAYSQRDIQGLDTPAAILPTTFTIADATAESTPEAVSSACTLTSSKAVNVRKGPGRNYPVTIQAHVGSAAPAQPVAQAIGSDGFTWYKLGNIIDAWVRSDVVDAAGDCASLPVAATVPPTPVVNTVSTGQNGGLHPSGSWYQTNVITANICNNPPPAPYKVGSIQTYYSTLIFSDNQETISYQESWRNQSFNLSRVSDNVYQSGNYGDYDNTLTFTITFTSATTYHVSTIFHNPDSTCVYNYEGDGVFGG